MENALQQILQKIKEGGEIKKGSKFPLIIILFIHNEMSDYYDDKTFRLQENPLSPLHNSLALSTFRSKWINVDEYLRIW